MCDTVVIKADELTVEGYAVSTDGQAKVIDIDLLHDLLLDNTIWMKCDEPTLNMLFTGLSSLIGAECQHCDSNKEAFINAHVVELILHNCHVSLRCTTVSIHSPLFVWLVTVSQTVSPTVIFACFCLFVVFIHCLHIFCCCFCCHHCCCCCCCCTMYVCVPACMKWVWVCAQLF